MVSASGVIWGLELSMMLTRSPGKMFSSEKTMKEIPKAVESWLVDGGLYTWSYKASFLLTKCTQC